MIRPCTSESALVVLRGGPNHTLHQGVGKALRQRSHCALRAGLRAKYRGSTWLMVNRLVPVISTPTESSLYAEEPHTPSPSIASAP